MEKIVEENGFDILSARKRCKRLWEPCTYKSIGVSFDYRNNRT